MESYFSWDNPGIYHFVGSPSSGFLRDVKLFILELVEKNLIFWIDFPGRFGSYDFKGVERLDSLQVFQPDTLDTSIKTIDRLEINYLSKSKKTIPYLLVADFPFWYALGKESNRSVLTKVTLIVAWLSMFTIKYNFKVLLINELRMDPKSGSSKPYLDFLIHRYITENFYKD